MAYNPKFRKPFRPGGGDDRRSQGKFLPRYGNAEGRAGDDRPRAEGFRPQGSDPRGFGGGGEGGFRPRRDWGGRDDRGGAGGGFRPRPQWGQPEDRGGDRGGFRPRPAFGGGEGGGFRPRGEGQPRPGRGPDQRPFESAPGAGAPPPGGDDLLSAMEGEPRGRPGFHGASGADFRPRPRRDWRDERGGGGGFRDDRGPRGGGYRDDRGPRAAGGFDDRPAWKRPHNAPLFSDLRDDEMKLVGRNACRALFTSDPRRLIRLYLFRELLEPMDDLIKFCRQNKLAYHVVEAEEMERVADSDHHEGMCMVVKRKPSVTVRDFLEGLPSGGPCCVVALDGVANPHNIGAITRVAAHFGAQAIISANVGAIQSGATARTAEGALEHVQLIGCEDLNGALTLLKVAGFAVFATTSHGGESLFSAQLPERSVFLLGAEGDGLSDKIMKAADRTLCVPGSGKVESLNVACAASVLLAEYWRAHPSGIPA